MLAAHLVLTVPPGHTEALAPLAAALQLRAQLQAQGVPVSLAKNRLRAHALNIVFGAEWGFDAQAAQGQACVLALLAPPGAPDAQPPSALHPSLRQHPLLVLHPAQAAPWRPTEPATTDAPPVWLWQPGAGLPPTPGLPLAQRPIPLLLPSPPNPRQQALLAGLAQLGVPVTRIDPPLAGPERASLLAQARAVLLLLAADGASPDTALAAEALAAGAAVLAERPAAGPPHWPPPASLCWFEPTPAGLGQALGGAADGDLARALASPAFAHIAQQALDHFAQAAAQAPQAGCAFWPAALAWWQQQQAQAAWQPPQPDRLNAAMAAHLPDAGYRPGWFNIAPEAAWAPDAVLALHRLSPEQAQALAQVPPPSIPPAPAQSAPDAPAAPAPAGRWRLIDLGDWQATDPAHAQALDAAGPLLAEGGRVLLRWALPPGTPPTQAEDLLQAALAPWTTQFWQRSLGASAGAGVGPGGLHHCWQLAACGWLDAQGQPSPAPQPGSVTARVLLTRRPTTLAERSQARTWRPDLGLNLV